MSFFTSTKADDECLHQELMKDSPDPTASNFQSYVSAKASLRIV
jgi:hypothetical protein